MPCCDDDLYVDITSAGGQPSDLLSPFTANQTKHDETPQTHAFPRVSQPGGWNSLFKKIKEAWSAVVSVLCEGPGPHTPLSVLTAVMRTSFCRPAS